MSDRIDPLSGKPYPARLLWEAGRNEEKCEECGTELIDRCLSCGAPVCCPKCCAEATAELLSSVAREEAGDAE